MIEENELSEREIEIIRLVATGASNKEIAHILVISPNTVKVHLRNIFTKMGVVSRTEATMMAIRLGWVTAPALNSDRESASIDTLQLEEITIPEEGQSKKFFKTLRWLMPVLILLFVALGFLLRPFWFQPDPVETIQPSIAGENISTQRWLSLQPVPAGLSGMAAVTYEQAFFLIGGETEAGISDQVWIYTIETDQWSSGEPLPYGVKEVQSTVLGEKFYVPGGIGKDGKVSDRLMVYDPRSSQWEEKSKIPRPLCQYALVALEGNLYLFGGWDGSEYSADVYLYYPGLDQWKLFADLPQARANAGAAVVGGRVYLFGGKNESGLLDAVDVFFPQRQMDGEDAWEEAAALPDKRNGMGVAVLADMVYLAGGFNTEKTTLPLIQYIPQKDSWLEIDQPANAVGFLPAVLPFETRLYIIGGWEMTGFQTISQSYQAVYTILVPVVR
jgi:DNA-binding CsgD family transcriptional regulator/N-acetylneuraminic acid mutarotase